MEHFHHLAAGQASPLLNLPTSPGGILSRNEGVCLPCWALQSLARCPHRRLSLLLAHNGPDWPMWLHCSPEALGHSGAPAEWGDLRPASACGVPV